MSRRKLHWRKILGSPEVEKKGKVVIAAKGCGGDFEKLARCCPGGTVRGEGKWLSTGAGQGEVVTLTMKKEVRL
jgi:hypothetical protein